MARAIGVIHKTVLRALGCEVRAMQKDSKELFAGLSTAASIGWYMLSSVVVGIAIGRWIDGYFGSQPWATIVGIVLGMVAGMWAIYKKVVGGK